MLAETLHDSPCGIQDAHLDAAQAMFAGALKQHSRKHPGAICYVADLARKMFYDWVRRHQSHERFAERFPIEGPDTARLHLLLVDLEFRKSLRGTKMPRPRPRA